MDRFISVLLNLCLVLFLASGALSVIDDSLALFFGLHLLTQTSELLFLLGLFVTVLVYVLMGLTPIVPMRVFLPIALFYAAGLLAVFPILIYGYDQVLLVDLIMSFCQVVFGLGILWWLRGGLSFRWPLVEDKYLGERPFSWLNLSLFVGVNVLVLPPALAAYLALCGVLAVNHFTDGFLTLHQGGLTV